MLIKKRGGKRSWVWDHFILENDGKATCPYCKTKIASTSKKNGTGSLLYTNATHTNASSSSVFFLM